MVLDKNMSILALVLNIVLPLLGLPMGVGTFIVGKTKEGLIQLIGGIVLLILMMICTLLSFLIIPSFILPIFILIFLGLYVWSIVVVVKVMNTL